MHERRHSGEVIVPHFGTLSTRTSEMGNRLVEVERIPESPGVEDESEGAELIFLAFAVAFSHLTSVAMKELAGEVVAGLVAIELNEHPPTVGLVVDVRGRNA